jgi:DMSO/TMAO reductase YedYZ molybdopterin-dependent catalytic subunit
MGPTHATRDPARSVSGVDGDSTSVSETSAPPVPGTGRDPDQEQDDDPAQVAELDGTPVGRRIVLGMAALGAAGIVVGAKVQAREAALLEPLTSRDPTGLTHLIPGTDRFRIYTVTGSLPSRSRSAWRLRITGLVDHERTLRFGDLLDLPTTALTVDFQCVTGWRVHDVHWKGVRLRHVLDAAGVSPSATHVRFTSFDGAYSESLTLAEARRDDVLVAYEMLDRPIGSIHGGPVRMYVAPMYGYKSIKWLDGIELTSHEVPGYWEQRGYDVEGWVGQSNGRDDHPTTGR